jgi:hypothetical protein
MANFVYTKAKESLLRGEINASSSNYRVALINAGNYTPNISSDQYFSQIPSNAVVAVSGNVQNITSSNGILDGDDVTISHDGTAFDSIVLYQVGSSNSNSRLFFYIDNSPGLPFEGSNSSLSVTITWSDTASKILAL